MLKLLEEKLDYWPENEYSERQSLTRIEIMELLPYVNYRSHTKSLPLFSNCSKSSIRSTNGRWYIILHA